MNLKIITFFSMQFDSKLFSLSSCCKTQTLRNQELEKVFVKIYSRAVIWQVRCLSSNSSYINLNNNAVLV